MYSKQRLQKRWYCLISLTKSIPPEKLPAVDLEGRKGRKTFRYRLPYIKAYETKYMIGSVANDKESGVDNDC